MNQHRVTCEWPTCGREAVNDIVYRDHDGYETYYTYRCEQHTFLDEMVEEGCDAQVSPIVLTTLAEAKAEAYSRPEAYPFERFNKLMDWAVGELQ